MNHEINQENPRVLPVLALRGLVLFPGMMLHFDVGRKKSILALKEAMDRDQTIFLVSQDDITVDDPPVDGLCEVGAVAIVRQVVRQTDEGIRVLVEGLYRAELESVLQEKPILKAKVVPLQEKKASKTARTEALMRSVKGAFEQYLRMVPRMPPDVIIGVQACEEAGKLADFIASNVPMHLEQKQELLSELSDYRRLDKLLAMLVHEIRVLGIELEINSKVQNQIDDNQREYFLREQIKAIAEELGEGDSPQSEAEEFKDRVLSLRLAPEVEEKLLKECDRLFKMPFGSHEANVTRNYLDACLDLPWNALDRINIDLNKAQRVLDRDHYGLTKVKERIVDLLAVRKLAPEIKGQIICLVGPPGVGKTSIAKSVAKAVGCKYVRIALGGVRDESDIRGHRKTYIGAMPGRIMAAVKQAGTRNPLILLDEVDKLGSDFRGDPTSALLEVLDAEQNNSFHDHYIDLPFDLSDVLFITTANDYTAIPEPLRDRMDVITLSSYTHDEKFYIAKKHLIRKQLNKHGMTAKMFHIADDALHAVLACYTKEAGVRTLERTIATLMRKAAKILVNGEASRVTVSAAKLEELLGPKKFLHEKRNITDQVGVVTGLAWTSVGGETMPIEAAVMEGTGKLELTGSLGDVMKESAHLAVSCVRCRAKQYNIDPLFYKNRDLHIHAPEGAVPKDGPSAGVTMVTALVSALSGMPVRHEVAMTGEITLRGRVLPIGGLKEKSMAAYRDGVKTIIIAKENEPDLAELDPSVQKNIQFIAVEDVDEVLKNALLCLPEECKDSQKKSRELSQSYAEKSAQPNFISQ